MYKVVILSLKLINLREPTELSVFENRSSKLQAISRNKSLVHPISKEMLPAIGLPVEQFMW
jgi:hypothetical protein